MRKGSAITIPSLSLGSSFFTKPFFNTKKSERNTTIDAIRFFAAFLIVFIHSGAFSEWAPSLGYVGAVLQALARLAVPFFFLASGYFLYTRNQSDQAKRIFNSFERIFKITLLGTLLFIAAYYFDHNGIAGLFDRVNPHKIVNIFLYSKPIIGGIMWYLFALLGAYFILWINALYLKKDMFVLTLGIVTFTIGMFVSGNYTGVLEGIPTANNIGIYRSFWGFGLLFVVIGYLMHKRQDSIMLIDKKSLGVYSIIFSLLYLIEYYSFFRVDAVPEDTFISLPFLASLIFAWCLVLPRLFSTTILPKMGATYSLYIYMVHPIILESIIGATIKEPLLRLVIAFSGSVLVAILYYHGKLMWARLYKNTLEHYTKRKYD